MRTLSTKVKDSAQELWELIENHLSDTTTQVAKDAIKMQVFRFGRNTILDAQNAVIDLFSDERTLIIDK